MGGHSPTQSQAQREYANAQRQIKLEKIEYAFWIGHTLSLGFTKLALLFLLRRIFRGRARRVRFDYINWFLIILVILWTTAFTFAEIFSCGIHFGAAWGTYYELTHDCINTFNLFTTSAVFNFWIDIMILILPLVMVSPLRERAAASMGDADELTDLHAPNDARAKDPGLCCISAWCLVSPVRSRHHVTMQD